MRSHTAVFVRVGVALAMAAALAWLLDPRQVLAEIAQLDAGTALVAAGLLLAGLPFAAWRWQIMLLRAGTEVTRLEALRLTLVGMVAGLGLPSAQGADVVRGVLLRAQKRSSLDRILSSLLADRIYGILSIGLIALPGVAALGNLADDRRLFWLTLAFCLTALAAVPFLPLFLRTAERLLRPDSAVFGERRLARLRHWLANVLLGMHAAFSDRRTAVGAVALSLVVHLLAVLSAWLLGRAIGLEAPAWAYLAFVPLVWVVTMLPLTLAGLGVREASFAVLFQLVGVPAEQGTALGLLVSATSILAVLAGGALSLLLPSEG